MTELFSDEALKALGLALVQFVWQGAVIAALVAGAFMLLRKASPNARYLVGCLGLAAMVAAPVLTLATSSRRAPEGAHFLAGIVSRPDAPVRAVPLPSVTQPNAIVSLDSFLGVPPEQVDAWLPLIAGAWSLGVCFLTLRVASGWLTVLTLKRRVVLSVPDVWTEKTAAIARALGIARQVTIGISASVDVPTVIGWLRPLVLVPASTFAGLSPFQFEAILAHELAHVRRHDFFVNVLQNAAETLLFYHPAVWWLSNRVRAEREHCCDDVAVEYCGDRVAYAGALASLEGLRLRAPILAVAANSGDLLSRIQRVLGVPTQRATSPVWVLAILVLAPFAAPLVGAEARPTAPPVTVTAPSSQAVVSQTRTPAPETPVRPVQQPVTAPPAVPAPPPQRQEPPVPTTNSKLEERVTPLQQRVFQYSVVNGFIVKQAAPVAGPPSSVASLEELLRVARLTKDTAALSQLLDPEFTSTAPTGATWNRAQAQEEFRTSPITVITIESVSGAILETTAFTTGVQVQIANGTRERIQFTRVWKAGAPTWKLVRSIEFKLPVAGLGTIQPDTGFRVGGDVKEPNLLTKINPIYPPAAKAAREQGLVVIEATIDPQGNVADARLIKSASPMLDQSALEAVRRWQYSPTLLAGQPVSVMLNVNINFALQ